MTERVVWAVVFLSLAGCADNGGDGPPTDAGPGVDSANTPCMAGARMCVGNQVRVCRANGTGYDNGETCMGGASCDPSTGMCVTSANACAAAAASKSYIGCEYWPTTTLNDSLDQEFEFAVVIANPATAPAMVTVDRGGTPVTTVTVPPQGIQTVRLPWVQALFKPSLTEYVSSFVPDGAYHLVSSLPVTVYQFNPLDYRIARDCMSEDPAEMDSQCFSYTNDASLLLPTAALTQSYMVMSLPTQFFGYRTGMNMEYGGYSGFVAIVATRDGTSVGVELSSDVLGTLDGTLMPTAAGQTIQVMMNAGDVLELMSDLPQECPADSPSEPCNGDQTCDTQIFCKTPRTVDLTGTIVRATQPIAVYSGHSCPFVPFNRYACDHVEEAMLPGETWGKELVVAISEPLRGEPNVIRVLSGVDNNMITFDPAVSTPTTLMRGQFVEFEARDSFVVKGSGPLLVGQFMVGQDYAGNGTGEGGLGDPSLSLGVPREQFRTQYTFLAPSNYDINYANLIAPTGAQVTLDGQPVSAPFTPIGATGLGVARVRLAGDSATPGSGRHDVTSSMPVGVIVYGYGQYTSYMYPAGLNLEMISGPF